jgi:hypothetical protein
VFVFGALTYQTLIPTSFRKAEKYQGNQQSLTFAKKFNVKGLVCFYDQGDEANKHYRAQTHRGKPVGNIAVIFRCHLSGLH